MSSPARPTRSARPLLLLAAALAAAVPARAQVAPTAASMDSVFAGVGGSTAPGCAVAVGLAGTSVLERAYGMADLEHGVPNTPSTVFEGGSLSKQFTAAAVVLLALEGKLSLEDDVRTWIPELPDYGETVTIRHLLNHTSGLRDWGSVAALEGWPRTTRVHDHDHVLDILGRQRSLNYRPGEHYSYTNSGYNLQAILVERVAGVPFAEFSRTRIFEPLGLDDTGWRDDYRRIVPGRAQAYEPDGDGGWRLDMPFEQVHGNGGILTTVGDLLTWTEALETGALGGPAFKEEMHRQGVLNDGRTIAYASGLRVSDYRGVPQVSHSGSTAGYRAHLTRFPEQGAAVAVLCNAASASAGGFLYEVADRVLAGHLAPPPVAPAPAPVTADVLARRAGVYRDTRTHEAGVIELEDGALELDGRPLLPRSATRFVAWRTTLVFDPDPPRPGGTRTGFVAEYADGDRVRFEPVPRWSPGSSELAEFEGSYRSDEAEATYTFEVVDGALHVRGRYGEPRPLRPVYRDFFEGRGGTWRFLRGADGRIVEVSAIRSRVWDLRFARMR